MQKAMNDKELERDLLAHSRSLYEQKTFPGLYFSQNMGNMYTPSLYYSLFSFLSRSVPSRERETEKISFFTVIPTKIN